MEEELPLDDKMYPRITKGVKQQKTGNRKKRDWRVNQFWP
jgi:hypothetical protein